jgi:hypothetical protein
MISENKLQYAQCAVCGKPTFFNLGFKDRTGLYMAVPVHDGDCLIALQKAYPDVVELKNESVYEWIRSQYIKEANKP